jgi:hypothetical protein
MPIPATESRFISARSEKYFPAGAGISWRRFLHSTFIRRNSKWRPMPLPYKIATLLYGFNERRKSACPSW